MAETRYRPLSLNLERMELGAFIDELVSNESRQNDSQTEIACRQGDDRPATSSIEKDSDTKTSRHPKSHRTVGDRRAARWKHWNPWGWEVVTLLVAISLSAAIAAILAKYDGVMQPKWPYGISLSAFVALLATLIRSLLLTILEGVISHSRWSWLRKPRPLYQLEILDQAGRGPWGSLNYLTRMRRLHPSTVSAITLILSLGINTFTQQAIRSVPCIQVDPTTEAWVRTAQTVLYEDSYSLPPKIPNLDLFTAKALIQELDTTNEQSSFYCPSGNCTFATTDGVTYSSLGVCSKCADLAPKMDYVVTVEHPVDAEPYKTFWCRWPKRNSAGEERLGPDMPVGNFDCDESNGAVPRSCTLNSYFMNTSFTSYWTSSIGEDDWDPHISQNPTFVGRVGMVLIGFSGIGPSIDKLQSPCKIPIPMKSENSGPPELANKSSAAHSACWFYPCIKHYNGLISDGRLQETIIKTDLLPLLSNSTVWVGMNHTPVFGANRHFEYGSYIDPCYIDRGRVNHPTTTPFLIRDNGLSYRDRYHDPACWYGFGGFFDQLFMSSSQAWGSAVPSGLGDFWLRHLQSLNWYRSPDLMDPLDRISMGMENIATVMTNALREVGNDSYGRPGKAYGTVLTTASCIEISWPWLYFPTAIVLATLYVLLYAVLDSIRDSSPMRTWKSSVLPLLYYGLDNNHRKGELTTEHDLSEDARQRKVCLRRDDKGDCKMTLLERRANPSTTN
ncbi:hypothetical protein GGR51DRAFT_572132 [Nemania sp. FL0031]|nr:hypothetical protein GGR51DRAFT_572132 [Nemania sp. FL0031]